MTVDLYGLYEFRWTLTNPTGATCNTTDNVQIGFTESANAGTDQQLCEILNTTLNGNTPSAGAGNWSIVSKPIGSNVIFGDAASPTSTLTVDAYGVYVIRWTLSIPVGFGCNTFDDVEIWFDPKPIITAVNDTLCNNGVTAITPQSVTTSSRYGIRYTWTAEDVDNIINGEAPSTGNGYRLGRTIFQQLNNPDLTAHRIIYHITPWTIRADSSLHCAGDMINVEIWVDPTPKLSVVPSDTIVCDSSTVTINVTDRNGFTQGEKLYNLTTTYDPLAVSGVEADGEKPAGTDFSDQLINHTNAVQTVEYHFKARIRHSGIDCEAGTDTTITVYVQPTPKLSVSIADTIVCDSTNITITVDDLNGNVHPNTTKVYQLTTTNPGGVLNVQPTGEYPAGTDITNQLINPTSAVQTVIYHFKARIRDDRPGHIGNFCDQGGDTTITVYVQPTPKLSVSIADTIVCDSTTITITVDDLNGNVHQNTTKVYQLTTTNAGGVIGVQPTGEYPAGTDITNQLINPTSAVQTVIYHFKARIRDDRPGHIGSFCDEGGDTTITVYVQPTPKLSVSIADTIVCDSTTITITVDDLNGNVHQNTTKVYQLTTTNPGGVLNVQPTGEYPAGTDITNQLINPTSAV
ncbi:MAG: hypothetical protein QUT27_06260, partial [candidate division Zixibacteria bacterium]|nr:hypothetical protein [candidate division Zixibacteria bacterium]